MWRAYGGAAAWDSHEAWFAAMLHTGNVANWQRTKDGRTGKNQPKPVEPPPLRSDVKAKEDRIAKKAARFQERMRRRQVTGPAERAAPGAPPPEQEQAE